MRATTSRPATPKQVKYLRDLTKMYEGMYDQLTTKTASGLISAWRNLNRATYQARSDYEFYYYLNQVERAEVAAFGHVVHAERPAEAKPQVPQVVADKGACPQGYERPAWVYAHGLLENDLKTDLIFVDLKGKTLADRLEAECNGKKVVFHLYKSRFGMLTGAVTYDYAADEEAYAYGRDLVRRRPDTF